MFLIKYLLNMSKTATEQKWNCVTSQAFRQRYIQYLMEDEDTNDGVQVKRMKLDPAEDIQVKTIITTNNWHTNLCKCSECLKMYENYNVEFLLFIKTIECLPTEILLKIFKNLLRSDRLIASLCCKRFQDIWVGLFPDDRHRLVFDDCILARDKEPVSTFTKSTRIYQHLVFGNVKMPSISIFDEKFAENVTTVELMHDPEHVKISLLFLSQFPNLKTIKVADIDILGDFSQVPTTIDSLVIASGAFYDDRELDNLRSYLDKTRDSFRIEMNVNYVPLKVEMPNFTRSQFTKIKGVHNMDLRFQRASHSKNILMNLEEQYPALENLSIDIFQRLPHKNLTCLKTLKAWSVPMEQMSRINSFNNLTTLHLHTEGTCFHLHDAFLNKNLTKLLLRSFKSRLHPCSTCFQTAITAFPNLENASFDFKVTDNHLRKLKINAPKLKSLSLLDVDSWLSLEHLPNNLTELNIRKELEISMIDTCPSMLQLRHLHIHLYSFYIEYLSIFERMPFVEELKIVCDNMDQIRMFEEAIAESMKRLRKLEFIHFDERIQPEYYSKIRDAMAMNCNYLRCVKFYTADRSTFNRDESPEKLVLKFSSVKVRSQWSK